MYLPDEAGRWKGLMITRISEKVVQLMREKYEKGYKEVLSDVCLLAPLSNKS